MPEAIPFETGFGRRLRHERERRKISLSTIAASTKISVALLEGLEREDLSRWPSGIFRRSFVRSYAQAIGLDPEAVVAEFLARFPNAEEAAAELPADGGATQAATGARRQPARARSSDVLRSARTAVLKSAGTLRSAGESARRSASVLRNAKDMGRAPLVRLRIVEALRVFRRGTVVADARRRWAAAAWDAGVLIAVALILFVVVNSFWKPFGVLTLTYYVGGIVLLGNTPGVCLFASVPPGEGGGEPPLAAELDAFARRLRDTVRRIIRR